MRSFMYVNPHIYDTFIRVLYFDGLKILKKIVGVKKSVFEAACGYGRLQKYIDPSCTYTGIDLNEKFVEFGRKKNRDIRVGNVLDVNQYHDSDVILLADILHHLTVKDSGKLLAIAVRFAREKILIIEPAFVKIGAQNNLFSRMIGKIMKWLDADGFNEIEKWLSRDEYDAFFKSLKEANNIREMRITHFRRHHFVEMIV
ncbi:MAG: class I SAM-dependent methyltransferase [Candidatus Aminicenantes bacterium]|nr:class I SAM-dependent methyltransferase [Candidatus Aminicenantes bacterium]